MTSDGGDGGADTDAIHGPGGLGLTSPTSAGTDVRLVAVPRLGPVLVRPGLQLPGRALDVAEVDRVAEGVGVELDDPV